jgi:hypothetical protein
MRGVTVGQNNPKFICIPSCLGYIYVDLRLRVRTKLLMR